MVALNVTPDSRSKWNNLVNQIDKSAGTPITDRMFQGQFYDYMDIINEYTVKSTVLANLSQIVINKQVHILL